MPNATGTAAVSPGVLLFTVPLNKKGKIDAINIDNEGTHGRIQFILQDNFSQDVSANNNAVTARAAEPWTEAVDQNAGGFWDVFSLGKIELLGSVYLIASVTDAAAVANVQFHFE